MAKCALFRPFKAIILGTYPWVAGMRFIYLFGTLDLSHRACLQNEMFWLHEVKISFVRVAIFRSLTHDIGAADGFCLKIHFGFRKIPVLKPGCGSHCVCFTK